MPGPTEGETHVFERTFTAEDVERFATVSKDVQPRHTDPGDGKRAMVHGLLTATLPTKIGGDLEMLAHEMCFEFTAPVYAGDTVRCEWTNRSVEKRGDRYDVTADIVCENGEDEVVLTGTVEGHLRADG